MPANTATHVDVDAGAAFGTIAAIHAAIANLPDEKTVRVNIENYLSTQPSFG